MAFVPKNTKNKEKSGYKTLYLSQSLIERINDIAQRHDTSFNNVVVSMIEECLRMEDEDESTQSPPST